MVTTKYLNVAGFPIHLDVQFNIGLYMYTEYKYKCTITYDVIFSHLKSISPSPSSSSALINSTICSFETGTLAS